MGEEEIVVLNERDILRAALHHRHATQQSVADKLGMSPNALSQNINRSRISMDNFKKILDAMDYDIYIVDRNTGESEWCVDVDE